MFPSRHLTFEMKKVEQLRIELCHWILEAHRNTYILNHTAGHLFISIEIALIDYLRPMKTIQPIPSVHPQSLFNHLNRPWIDLGRPWMTYNDPQWLPMTSNDLQWLTDWLFSANRIQLCSRVPYLIFVIFSTRAKFLENKIYTEKTRKLRKNTQIIANFFALLWQNTQSIANFSP